MFETAVTVTIRSTSAAAGMEIAEGIEMKLNALMDAAAASSSDDGADGAEVELTLVRGID